MNVVPRLWVGRLRVCFCFFTKIFLKLTINRNWKKLTDSRKRAKILADNRKSHHPIETLLLLLLYNIFCFAMWVFDGSVWKRYERFIEHLKTTDSRQSTKVLWRTTFYLDSVRILLWLCIMFNEESTVAQREYYIIFFAKLSCDLVYFVLESSSSR